MDYTFENMKKWASIGPKNIVGWISEHIAEQDEQYTLVVADAANRIGIQEFLQKHPDKFIEVGIAETNLVGVAAAMAQEGYHVAAVAYAPFITARVLDAVRVNMGYMKAPVVLIGLGAALCSGDLGATHTSFEDIANMRDIPEMVVISPADCTETVKAYEAAITCGKPVYLRLTAGIGQQMVYHDDYDYQIGKSVTLKEGTDIAFITTGTITYQVMQAVNMIEEQGISCKVINMHTIKPLDIDSIKALQGMKKIYTVEEHNIIGGLGSAVAEVLAEMDNMPRLRRIGIQDRFFKANTIDKLWEEAGLTPKQIADQVLN